MSAVRITAQQVEVGQVCYLDKKAGRITQLERSKIGGKCGHPKTCLTYELHEGGRKQRIIVRSRVDVDLAYVAVEEMQLLDTLGDAVTLLDEDNEVHELPMPEDPRVAAELAKAAPVDDVMVEVTTISTVSKITRCLR
eukprot:TRINITY_DN1291_c0_g1_i5.p1 TRINITY_DN1291_c0_g1~~TRINITY_DN1291_c0_g1_i5.p1  ORF type:complete len:138 (+),score=36.43 TRINITY_DN1291_c0_g1_i5:230-643(+)